MTRTARVLALDVALPLSVCLALVIVAIMLAQLTSSLARSNLVHVHIEGAMAEVAAEEAAFEAASRIGAHGALGMASACGMPCSVNRRDDALGSKLRVCVEGKGARRYWFESELLVGGGPEAFAHPLSLGLCAASSRVLWRTEELWMPEAFLLGDARRMPHLRDELRREPEPPSPATGLVKHDTIALQRLPGGTDLPDWVFRTTAEGMVRPEIPASGVLCIAGHLWLDAGAPALTIVLDRSLTLVVFGNVYLGRSLRVLGGGRLYLCACQRNGSIFRDADGNGRFTPDEEVLRAAPAHQGCLEGNGAVYLGLPGTTDKSPITIEASVMAEGDAYLTAGTFVVQGALVAGETIVRLAPQAHLTCTGERLPDVARERIPGFATNGGPRPGRLVRLR